MLPLFIISNALNYNSVILSLASLNRVVLVRVVLTIVVSTRVVLARVVLTRVVLAKVVLTRGVINSLEAFIRMATDLECRLEQNRLSLPYRQSRSRKF